MIAAASGHRCFSWDVSAAEADNFESFVDPSFGRGAVTDQDHTACWRQACV